MPLDLPPPPPPQQTEVATLKQHQTAAGNHPIKLHNGDYTLLVSGNTYLDADRIRKAAKIGKTPSQIILLLNALYEADGHPLVNIQYARSGQTIYVQVNEARFKHMRAPAMLAPFFDSFHNRPGLTRAAIEPERALAQIKAERAGLQTSLHYRIDPDSPRDYTLLIDAKPKPDYQPLQLSLSLGNPGNRFLGRYFALSNLALHAPNGDVYTFGYARGFPDLGDSRGGDRYDRYQGGYSTVTPYGLYGFNASYTGYAVHGLFPGLDNDHERARIVDAKFSGNQFLYADRKTRLIAEEELGYVDSIVKITRGTTNIGNNQAVSLAGQKTQDEHYGLGKLGLTLSRAWRLFGRSGSLNASVDYRRGFAGSADGIVDPRRTADFNILHTRLRSSYSLPAQFLAGFNLEGQWAPGDRVTQQQQWVLGGPNRLNAFLPGILVGDSGAYARLHLQLPRWQLFGLGYRFSVFAEGGSARYEDSDSGTEGAGFGDTRSVADAGLKLEIAPLEGLNLTFYAAQPVAHHNVPRSTRERLETAFFFTVQVKL